MLFINLNDLSSLAQPDGRVWSCWAAADPGRLWGEGCLKELLDKCPALPPLLGPHDAEVGKSSPHII